jgi:hypothetical protein
MTNSLTNALAAQLIGYHVGPQSVEKYNEKPTNIVYAANGVFRVVKTPIALFKTEIGKVETKQPVLGIEAMTAGPELLIPKIPFRYLQMILSWYRDIETKDHTEASVLFFWNHNNVALPVAYADDKPINGLLVDGQLIIYCPIQRNSAGLSEFHMDTMVGWLRENTALLCETHSHNTMNAFFSGTDDANENATQFYGVWGKVTSAEPAFAFRYVSGDQKIQIPASELFEWPKKVIKTIEVIEEDGKEPIQVVKETKEELIKGPFEHVDYPEDWMPQHSKAVYIRPATTPSTGHQGPNYVGAKDYTKPYDYKRPYDNLGSEQEEFERNWQDHIGSERSSYYYDSRAENHSKKITTSHNADVGGDEKTLANADVIEFHNVDDFVNLRIVENEVKDIAEDLHDYDFSTVIESAIKAGKDELESRVTELEEPTVN